MLKQCGDLSVDCCLLTCQRSVDGEADCRQVVVNGRLHHAAAHVTSFHQTTSEVKTSTRPTHQVLTTLAMPINELLLLLLLLLKWWIWTKVIL